jgi:hypothetical protein
MNRYLASWRDNNHDYDDDDNNNNMPQVSAVLLNYKPRGYRNIGRPMARWEDAFS